MLDTSEAAEDRNAAPSLDDEADERKRLEDLQHRAAALGYTLHEVRSGFVLRRGTHSRHTPSIETIATLVGRLEGGR